jgi:hypothetical protein
MSRGKFFPFSAAASTTCRAGLAVPMRKRGRSTSWPRWKAVQCSPVIVSEILYAPICDGGSMSDVMMLCESVLVGVLLECFKLGDDVKMLDLIVGSVKERLAKARLEDLETKGSG